MYLRRITSISLNLFCRRPNNAVDNGSGNALSHEASAAKWTVLLFVHSNFKTDTLQLGHLIFCLAKQVSVGASTIVGEMRAQACHATGAWRSILIPSSYLLATDPEAPSHIDTRIRLRRQGMPAKELLGYI